jgi:hypothetical protein
MVARATWIALAITLGIAHVASAQDVTPTAMTKEEIEKELNSAPAISGEVLYSGKRLCSLDSTKASGISVKLAGTKPSTWVRTGGTPSLALRLAAQGDAKRIVLVKDGALDSPVLVRFIRSRENPSHYELHFDKPLPPGDYEFAISSGKILLFPQCGFSVTTSSH